jgi:hypothetical protein
MQELVIPRDSIFRPVVNLFTATFNNPTLGKYNWGVAANQKQEVLKINYQNLFFISTMNFSSTVPESAFLENIETTPKVQFVMDQNNESMYGGAYPLVKYLTDNDISAFFWSRQADDILTATFTGQLGQNASLIAFNTVIAVLALNTYEITDKAFIENFFHMQKTGEQISNVVVPSSLERRI